MKNYTITVNGTVYEVSVEEGGAGSAPVRAAAPKAAPKAAPAAAAPKAAAGAAGSVEVTASVPGKVFKIEANTGATVKAGDPIVILEAMKMETTVVSTVNGKVDKIYVKEGEQVNQEDLLISFEIDE